jgi:hypothetical protein
LTRDMAYYVSLQLNGRISFMTEKGVGFAVQKVSGGYDLYSSKYASDFVAAWAKNILRGAEHDFLPPAH